MESSIKTELTVTGVLLAISVGLMVYGRKLLKEATVDMVASDKLKKADMLREAARADCKDAKETLAEATKVREATKVMKTELEQERASFEHAVSGIEPIIQSMAKIKEVSEGALSDEERNAAAGQLFTEMLIACESYKTKSENQTKIDDILKPISLDLEPEPEHV